eukprot:3153874-Amphidinium_carterae.1
MRDKKETVPHHCNYRWTNESCDHIARVPTQSTSCSNTIYKCKQNDCLMTMPLWCFAQHTPPMLGRPAAAKKKRPQWM